MAERDDEIVRLRGERLSMRAIAARVGVSHVTVRAVLARRGAPLVTSSFYTEEDAIAALRAYAEERGHPPTQGEWFRSGGRPATTTIVTIFGNWSNAMAAAGFETRGHDSRPDPWEADRANGELQARVDAGETLAALAAEAGVAPQSLGRRLARWRELYGEGAAPPPGPRKKRA